MYLQLLFPAVHAVSFSCARADDQKLTFCVANDTFTTTPTTGRRTATGSWDTFQQLVLFDYWNIAPTVEKYNGEDRQKIELEK